MVDFNDIKKDKNIVLMFPGQGSQHINMGMDFLEKHEKYFNYLKKVSGLLGKDLIEIIKNQDTTKEYINDTRFSQIAIFCISAAINDFIINDCNIDKGRIKAVIGHSLGDYTALYCAGAFSLIDGARLVITRGKLMANLTNKDIKNLDNIEKNNNRPGSSSKKINGDMMMAAVLGTGEDTIKNILKNYRDSVFIANYNDYSQIVISGYKEPVTEASEKIKKAGAKKIIPLKVNIASHCPLMGDVSMQLGKYIEENLDDFKNIDEINPDFFSSTELEYISKNKIKDTLKKQLISPIRWVKTVENLISGGANIFIEIGPGKVLSRLVERIVKHNGYEKSLIFNTSSITEIENLIDFLKSNKLTTF